MKVREIIEQMKIKFEEVKEEDRPTETDGTYHVVLLNVEENHTIGSCMEKVIFIYT